MFPAGVPELQRSAEAPADAAARPAGVRDALRATPVTGNTHEAPARPLL